MKLSQHGDFDPSLEKSVRRMLEVEFSEGADASEDFEFAQVCQRKDGSVYGTQGQCRKGTPISVGPGEGMPAIAKKAKERGLKQADVKSIADAVREKYGAKVVKRGSALESAVRRLNERLQPAEQKPEDRPVRDLRTESLQRRMLTAGDRGLEARREMVRRHLGTANVPPRAAMPATPKPKPEPKGEGTKAVDAKRRELQADLKHIRELIQANRGNSEAVRLYGSVEERLQKDLKKLKNAGSETKAKLAAARKPVGLDSSKLVVVNKKLLGQKTEVLQQILRDRSITPAQRRKIEEELGGRGVTPTQQRVVAPKRAPRAVAQPAKFDIPEGFKGYDVNAAYEQKGKILGSGAMGEAKLVKGPPPAIVKKGKIGENEAAAIKKLEGTGVTPTLYGATITGKATTVKGGLGGHVKEANGLLAMSPMDGTPALRSLYAMSSKEKTEMLDEYLKVRKAIHTRGVAHNDMHGGNFFYDPKTKKAGLVDFGLAQISPRAALVEAMGLKGGDWQASGILAYVLKDGPAMRQFDNNYRAVKEELRERFGIARLPDIRSKPQKLEQMLQGLSDRDAELLIERLYDGV